MAIKTRRMRDWLAQNGEAITAASKASMLKAVNDDLEALNDTVYILCLESNLLKIHRIEYFKKVKSSVTPIGIAVFCGDKRFVVGLHQVNLPFSDGTYPNKHTTFVTNRQTALGDFDVINKNKTLREGLASLSDEQKANYAIGYCSLYSAINDSGKGIGAGEWYLPSSGYDYLIYTNMHKINRALSLIDGADLIAQSRPCTSHTCTEYTDKANYFIDYNDGTSNGWQSTTETHVVRPMTFINNSL